MGGDFSYSFTDHNYEFNAEFYESLRMWPQTRIAYAIMEDESIRVMPIEIKMHQSASPPNCDEFAWSIPVTWKCKNEDNG